MKLSPMRTAEIMPPPTATAIKAFSSIDFRCVNFCHHLAIGMTKSKAIIAAIADRYQPPRTVDEQA